jgi:channel protein (hemolysin III family)
LKAREPSKDAGTAPPNSSGEADWLDPGGVVYSVGVAFFLIERIPHHKTIWHGFVLAAAALHFLAIAREFAV